MRSHISTHHNEASPRVEPIATAKTYEEAGFRLSPPVIAPKQHSKPWNPQQLSLLDQAAPLAGSGFAVPSEPSPAKRGGSPLYLSKGNRCNDEPEESEGVITKVKPCRCRKWYCPRCAPSMGRGLRFDLRERLKSFDGVYGITLTVDGALFPSPYVAWLYVMGKRCLSRFVEKLHKGGHLKSRDYFWVVEFQETTEQPHWHLLVNTLFIPFGVIVATWSAFRPPAAPKLPERITPENYHGKAPGFGSVRFTLQKSAPHRAAGYACKYLIKVPSYGFPDWVLDHEGNIPRYGRSRGFFPSRTKCDAPKLPRTCRGVIHPPECACSDCLQGITRPGHQKRRLRTLRDRLSQCEASSYLVDTELHRDEEGKLVEGKSTYRGQISVPFAAVCEEFGIQEGKEVIVPSASDERLRILEHQHGGCCSEYEDWEY